MGQPVDLVAKALRHKLMRDGAASLTDAEWHLLRVSHFLHALEDQTLDRILGDAPLADLLALGDALEAIAIPAAAKHVRAIAAEIAHANDPGLGLQRPLIVASLTARLSSAISPMRTDIEQRLLEYAFRQREATDHPPRA